MIQAIVDVTAGKSGAHQSLSPFVKPPSSLSDSDRIIGRTSEVAECNYNADSGYCVARMRTLQLACPPEWQVLRSVVVNRTDPTSAGIAIARPVHIQSTLF